MKTMQGLGEGIFRFAVFFSPGMIIVALLFPVQFSANAATWFYFLTVFNI